MRRGRLSKWVMLMVVFTLLSTPLMSYAGCTVYTHAEDGGFEPAAVSGASYYPLPDSLIYDSGPGLFTTDLVIQEGSQHATSEEYTIIGEANVWNTREEICVSIDTDDTWDLSQVYIYLGFEDIPVSSDGTPIIGEFPFNESFKKPVDEYKLVLNLEEEFEFTWGKWDRENRVWHVAIFAKAVEENEEEQGQKSVHEEACAVGLNGFDTRWGWYSNYMVEHPETGHFVDAPVGGADFDTSSHKGKTDNQGAFDYIPGESVTLSIGDLELGTVEAGHKISPLDLLGAESTSDIRAINMARILQSLDSDQDPNRGITIPEGATESLNDTMASLGITTLDFNDSELVDELITQTVEKANNEKNLDLRVVTLDEAKDNLDKGLQSNVFRKNISKTPEMLTTKAKLELMPVYVPARRANGDYITIDYLNENDEIVETREYITPLVVTYTDENEVTGASDVFAAVSRDDGNTWKITNISRSAGRSSFTLKDGTVYYGDVNKPQCKVRGNYILIGWTSKFARSGKPRYSIKLDDDYVYDDAYYVEDIFGVSGPQRSVDYTRQGFPELGEVPYSAVWTCRGIIDPETGDISWFKPERLTSGRRDACQLMFNGNPNTGFAMVWQEDPEGLRPGQEAGPGEGMSGATTNHKTDIWYSYISWEDFDDVDYNFVSGGEPEHEDELIGGREKVLVPFSMPIRLSDNDVVNDYNLKWYDEGTGQYVPALTDDSLSEEDPEAVDNYAGTHMYGYMIPGLIFEETAFAVDPATGYFDIESVFNTLNSGFSLDGYFLDKTNHQGVEKNVAITQDGRLLDGNTGASRPNIMLQPYDKDGDKIPDSAWVVVVYEETKGMGSGPPEGSGGGSTVTELDGESEQGSGEGAGADKYFPDQGKNVIYHSFDLYTPDLVNGGSIMNPQQVEYPVDAEGNIDYTAEPTLCWLEDEEGIQILDPLTEQPIPAYENARRPRLIIQSKSAALAGKEPGEEGTVMVCVFKMGDEGQGRPSDILMTRFVTSSAIKGNPYAFKNIEKDVDGKIVYQNISSVTALETEYSNGYSNNDDFSGKREPLKVLSWEQTEENLDDPTAQNPYDDARAHRGILRGDFLAIAYDWTPNWAPARNGNDHYDLFIRRSFDGGATWTTQPAELGGTEISYETVTTRQRPGLEQDQKELFDDRVYAVTYGPGEFEPARNVSMLRNNKTSVIEPRLVGTPSSIKTNGAYLYEDDIRDDGVFWVTYGTESYPGRNSDEVGEPLDLYYSYSVDYGQSYFDVTKTINPDSQGNHGGEEKTVWDWLAKDTGKHVAAQAEAQIRMTPDGQTFWAVWNETGLDGSDVKFRKISLDGLYGYGAQVLPADLMPPVISIIGVSDGDVSSMDIELDIELNEAGTFTAELYKNDVLFATLMPPIDPYYLIEAQEATDVYRLVVEAEDESGNTSSKTIEFTLDSRIPQITIEGVTNGETTDQSRTVTINATGDQNEIILKRNSVTVAGFESGDTLVEDGRYELTVVSTNSTTLQSSTMSIEWTIDLVPPEIKISNIKEGEIYYKSITPSINITDNHSSTVEMDILLELNGEPFISGSTIRETGAYTLYASAMDLAGHFTEYTVTFSIEEAITTTTVDKGNKKDQEIPVVEEVEIGQTEFEISESLKLYVPDNISDNDPVITIVNQADETTMPDNAVMVNGEIYEINLTDENGDLIESFDTPITFQYAVDDFTAGSVKDIKDLKISYWDEDYSKWIAIPTIYDAKTKTLTAETYHLSRFSVLNMPGFPDFEDIKGHDIECLAYKMASLGIVNGDEKGNFNAGNLVTREEMIKLLITASGEEPDDTAELSFDDAESVSDWARGYINTALNKGIVVGYNDCTIRAKNYVTGSESASMVVGMCNRNGITLQHGNPESGGHGKGWATRFIDELTTIGVIDDEFDYEGYLTRAEMIEMIMNAIDSKNNNEGRD